MVGLSATMFSAVSPRSLRWLNCIYDEGQCTIRNGKVLTGSKGFITVGIAIVGLWVHDFMQPEVLESLRDVLSGWDGLGHIAFE